MALNENLTLYLPFDETPGSTKAYDYSSGRNDGTVSGAQFLEGKIGNCAYFDGDASISVGKTIISFSNDFTISVLVKGDNTSGARPTREFCWIVLYPGIDQYLEKRISAAPGEWVHLALVKIGRYIRYYINGVLYDTDSVLTGTISGIRLEQDYYGTGGLGRGSADELQFFNKALTAEELLTLFDASSKLEYYIDGVNLKDYGVRVEGSDGIIDGLVMKTPFTANYLDEHGEVIDLTRPRFEPREISLSCWIKGEGGYMDFTNKVTSLLAALRAPGTHRLMIDINPTKPLVYQVYCLNGPKIKKTWNEEKMIGTFTLNLREPEPVKRVLKHIAITEATREISISIKSNRYYNIYWGDGEADYDVGGNATEIVTTTHTYAENGDYFPIITGVIEDILEFSSNAIVVWNEL